MMKENGRQYSPQEKLEIILAGLASENGIADVCRRYGISTTLYYQWKKHLLKQAPVIFKRESRKRESEEEKLRTVIQQKDRVIAIITEENLQLKKNLGE